MTPQQNSTLIDNNLDGCLPLPEELTRYSPILPPKVAQNLYQDKLKNHPKHTYASRYENLNAVVGPTGHQHKYKHYRSGSSRGGQSRRSRSISLHGVNSTVEQGNKEIPIWLDDEPRYVSGVTNKTTCNDIIKALIDDEIQNGNYTYCKRSKDGTASRDYSDYVITESWRGIERSYDGNMAILPVWKAWSRVHNELRLTLKHREDIKEPLKQIKTKSAFSSLIKYLWKILKFSKQNKVSTNNIKSSTKEDIPDEILFVILPDEDYNSKEYNSKPTNKLVKPSTEEEANKNFLKEKLYRLSETRSSIRKRRSSRKHKAKHLLERKRNTSQQNNNCIRRRKDTATRNSIRNKLAQKTSEMNELYQREYALTRQLTSKCKLYKLQNELYTNTERQLDLSVGEIQKNIENYAKDIIRTEHELLAIKNEIQQDISLINNLKRLTLDPETTAEVETEAEGDVNKGDALTDKRSLQVAKMEECEEQMKFVDNIYEFCDNNASMLV
ncbi:ras association domain-containing protein 10 [Teleopsis dalmanni]|uniref:ras association domain-containing protein 10 n=1 Tax=Teleopsis dalmanni TaxID=139649 RepID=UPI0018CECCD5|nr:ras association domain-containing protein 10 [Teleopsis dalmanni]